MMSALMCAAFAAAALARPGQRSRASSTAYSLINDYSGDDFFEDFDFNSIPDVNAGHVQWANVHVANSTGLAGFASQDGSVSNQQIYLGVDCTNIAPNGRPSVRVMSKQSYSNALVVADISHMPAPVCGTWPAFWMNGIGTWPHNGEIDIIESVNTADHNVYTLHTDQNIKIANDSNAMSGLVTHGDCLSTGGENNLGCSVVDLPDQNSYGDNFNKNGGGVFATLLDIDAIRIWFFDRQHIPHDILANDPKPPALSDPSSSPDTWGKPNALFRDRNYKFEDHFKDMSIIFSTNFCGEWAGKVFLDDPHCSALAQNCNDYVTNHPADFDEVYWLIDSVRVYQTDH